MIRACFGASLTPKSPARMAGGSPHTMAECAAKTMQITTMYFSCHLKRAILSGQGTSSSSLSRRVTVLPLILRVQDA